MKSFITLTDKDGDLIYIRPDVVAIYTVADKETVSSMFESPLRVIKANERRGIICRQTGQWEVKESYEEILTKLTEAHEAEELAKCGSSE